jgi:glycosyltransferase involved in cell wall biosynthesis
MNNCFTKPQVSVILAVFNGKKYLGEAIETVLAQTDTPIELIIVDDGSKDGTAEIARGYGSKIRYVYQENRGQPAAQNLGIRIAQGAYLSFIDADDLYLPGKIALQVECLEREPEIDMVFGYVEQFYSPDVSSDFRAKWSCPSEPSPGYLSAAGLFRRACFERVGFFNEEQRIGLFIDWYMRATELKLQQKLLPNLVYRRRIHENNMGVQSHHSRSEYLQVVTSALKRRSVHV